MANYQEARVKLTNTQLNKLKSAVKNKTGTILRLNKKNWRWRIVTWSISNSNYDKQRNYKMPLLIMCQQISNLVKLKYLT